MTPFLRCSIALLLAMPSALLAHPGHAPGEPEHWVVATLFGAIALTILAVRQRRAATRSRQPGEHE